MAREVDLLAGLVWEEVGGAGVPDKGVAVGGTVADAGAEGRQAEASLDPPVPPDIGRPHPDRARQFMPFAALRGYYDLVHAKEVVPEPRRPLADDEARALDGIIANLVRGDVVLRKCEDKKRGVKILYIRDQQAQHTYFGKRKCAHQTA